MWQTLLTVGLTVYGTVALCVFTFLVHPDGNNPEGFLAPLFIALSWPFWLVVFATGRYW